MSDRVLALALMCMTDPDAVGPLQDAIIEDRVVPARIVRNVPWEMGSAFDSGGVEGLRLRVARSMAAAMLFKDWPRHPPQWAIAAGLEDKT